MNKYMVTFSIKTKSSFDIRTIIVLANSFGQAEKKLLSCYPNTTPLKVTIAQIALIN